MANRVLADLAVRISANTAEFGKSLKNSERSLLSLEKTAGKLTRVLGAVGLGVSVGALAKSVFDLGVKAEQTSIAFNTFLGSATKGQQLLKQLNQFSIATPFTPDAVNSAAKALLSFGVEADKVIPTLKFLGDVSSGTGKDLTELAVIFGQIRSTGRLMGQDLLQLINAGFNPLQVISQQTGKSVAVLKKEMEQGAISFQMVEDAFKAATSEGGLFFNLMEKQSVTVGGKISTLEGNFQELGKTIFGLSSGPIPALVTSLNDLVVAINNALKVTSIEDIAAVSTEKFNERLKAIEQQLKSTDTEAKKAAQSIANAFAQDVVRAINETTEELKNAQVELDRLQSQPLRVPGQQGPGAVFGAGGVSANQSSIKELDTIRTRIEVLQEELEQFNEIKIDLFKFIGESADSNLTKPIPLLQQLEERLKELQKKQANAFDEETVKRYGREITKLSAEIAKLRSGAIEEGIELINIDPFEGLSLVPSGGLTLSTGMLPFQEELAAYLNTIAEVADDSATAVQASQEKTRAELLKTADVVLAYSSIFSQGLSDAISGQVTFAQALARTTDGIVNEYGRQAIAAMIAASVKDPTIPLPIAKIAATAAAVGAITGILRRSAGFRGKGGGGGGAGFGGQQFSRPTSTQFAMASANMPIQPDFVIKGQDLHVILSNYQRNQRYTRNG
jgi:tape measure domain-containing protein